MWGLTPRLALLKEMEHQAGKSQFPECAVVSAALPIN